MTYLVTLVTVLLKAALISECVSLPYSSIRVLTGFGSLWTRWTFLAIPGSLILTIAALPVYMIVAPAIGFSLEYERIVGRVYGTPIMWFTIVLLPIFLMLRDFTWKAYKRLFLPQPYHIVQEIQAFNLPDYRPRMEQFQKAIKKVRATQRMRRNRGFAFSQTEEGQEQLIRSCEYLVR